MGVEPRRCFGVSVTGINSSSERKTRHFYVSVNESCGPPSHLAMVPRSRVLGRSSALPSRIAPDKRHSRRLGIGSSHIPGRGLKLSARRAARVSTFGDLLITFQRVPNGCKGGPSDLPGVATGAVARLLRSGLRGGSFGLCLEYVDFDLCLTLGSLALFLGLL